MKAKKHLNLRIPLWWPSSPGWRRLARAMTPHPGTLIVMLVILAAILWAQSVGALPPRAPAAVSTSTGTIAYQGRLADAAGTPITDTVNMEFRLYDVASGGIFLWEELWTGSNSVEVSDGLFNVMLGSMEPIPQSVITGHDSLFLGITVGTDDEMTPRVQLGSVPFAMQALTVPDGSVTTAKIADGAVMADKASGFVVAEGANLLVQYAHRAPITGTGATIVFPRPFAARPSVVATADTNGGQNVTVRNINETQFEVLVSGTDGNLAINWIALGPAD